MKHTMKSNKTTDNRLSLALQRAQAAVLSRDYPLAIRLYNRLIISEGDNLELLLNLASVYIRANKDEKALKIYMSVQEKVPENFEVLSNLGGIYRRLGRYQDSIDILEKALQLGVDIEATKYSMGFTYKLMGKYDAAAECFMSVTDINPNDVLAYNQLGTIEDIRGNPEKAQHAFSRGLQIDPNHPILHLNASMCYLAQKEYDLAKKHCQDALKAKPGWPDAMSLYADLLELTDANDEAKKVLKSAVKLNPENAQLHTNLGNYYESKKDYANAQSAYLKALEISPENLLALYDLAHVYIQQKEFDEAIKIYEKLESLDGENEHLIMQHAKALMGMNKMDEAMKKIKGLENKNSNDLSTLNMFAQYFIRNKEIEKAKNYLHKIKENFPTASSYLLDNAEQYAFMGYYSESKNLLDKYLQINENDGQAWTLLGKNYKAVKLYSKALDAWKKGYELSKDTFILDDIGQLIKYFEPDSSEMKIISELLKLQTNNPDFETTMNVEDDDGVVYEECEEEQLGEDKTAYKTENTQEEEIEETSEQLFNLDASTLGEDPIDEYEALIFDENEDMKEENSESFLDLKSLVSNDIPEDYSEAKEKSHMFDNDTSKDYSQYDPVEEQEYMNVDGLGFEEEDLNDDDDDAFGIITEAETLSSHNDDKASTPPQSAPPQSPPAMQQPYPQPPYPQQQFQPPAQQPHYNQGYQPPQTTAPFANPGAPIPPYIPEQKNNMQDQYTKDTTGVSPDYNSAKDSPSNSDNTGKQKPDIEKDPFENISQDNDSDFQSDSTDSGSSASSSASSQDVPNPNTESSIPEELYLDDENLIDELDTEEDFLLPTESDENHFDDLPELLSEEVDEDFADIVNSDDFSIDEILPENLNDDEIFDNSDEYLIDDEVLDYGNPDDDEFDSNEPDSNIEDYFETDFNSDDTVENDNTDDVEDFELLEESNDIEDLEIVEETESDFDTDMSLDEHDSPEIINNDDLIPIAEYLPEEESEKFEDTIEEIDLNDDAYDYMQNIDASQNKPRVDDFQLLSDDEDIHESKQSNNIPESSLMPFSSDYFMEDVSSNTIHHNEIIEDDRPRETVMMNQVRKVIKKSFNSPPIKKFHNTAGMFESLRSLYDNYLSSEKKETLINNLQTEQLDYVAARIKNGPGLLSAAAALNHTPLQKK